MNHKPPQRAFMMTNKEAIRVVLTPYQMRVLHMLVCGQSQAVIAEVLGKHPRSIHQQVEAARLKLGCVTTYQLIAVITMSGVLDESDKRTA